MLIEESRWPEPGPAPRPSRAIVAKLTRTSKTDRPISDCIRQENFAESRQRGDGKNSTFYSRLCGPRREPAGTNNLSKPTRLLRFGRDFLSESAAASSHACRMKNATELAAATPFCRLLHNALSVHFYPSGRTRKVEIKLWNSREIGPCSD